MCGRYQRGSDKQKIVEAFALGNVGLAFELTAVYNVAPTVMQPVIAGRVRRHTRFAHDVLALPAPIRHRS
jgi:putative SOS response-associated peptidase YedK